MPYIPATQTQIVDFGAGGTLLSRFLGADENPLSEGGNWANLNTTHSNDLRRISQTVGCTASTTGESYWTPQTFGPDLDVWTTISTMPAAGNNIAVSARIQQPGGVNTYDGYRVSMIQNAGLDDLDLTIVTNAVLTQLDTIARDFAIGEQIGLRCVGNVIQSWYSPVGGPWTLASQVRNTTYTAAGSVALHVRGTTGRADDFGVALQVPLAQEVSRSGWPSRVPA